MEFPQFRKLKNGKAVYQITAPNAFTELQLVGAKWFKYEFEVSQFPDLLRIQDMLAATQYFEEIDASEYQAIFAQL
jgi:hypothetical protein